jgi:hypothetical protein
MLDQPKMPGANALALFTPTPPTIATKKVLWHRHQALLAEGLAVENEGVDVEERVLLPYGKGKTVWAVCRIAGAVVTFVCPVGVNETLHMICTRQLIYYTITIKHWLLIYTSMKHSLLSIKLLALALNFLDTLSDVRIKEFTLLI